MGIGNTTAAAAIAAALFGGGGARWAGRGTGVDDDGLARKRVGASTARSTATPRILDDPLRIAAAFGGRELAAILGATLAARRHNIPVLLDGFVCTAAVAPLYKLRTDTLAHALAGHVSAEAGHRMLLDELGLKPLLDLNMRLGEASGAAVALSILRAALACHTGMATFAEAGVSDKPAEEGDGEERRGKFPSSPAKRGGGPHEVWWRGRATFCGIRPVATIARLALRASDGPPPRYRGAG